MPDPVCPTCRQPLTFVAPTPAEPSAYAARHAALEVVVAAVLEGADPARGLTLREVACNVAGSPSPTAARCEVVRRRLEAMVRRGEVRRVREPRRGGDGGTLAVRYALTVDPA